MSSKANKEINAMEVAHNALVGLKPDEQARTLAWLAQKLGVALATGTLTTANNKELAASASLDTSKPGGQVPTAKAFMTQKKPSDFQERIACLAYYLTNYQNTPQFKTLEITKLNTVAGQPKLSNAAAFVRNSVKCQYLSSAGGSQKQITSRGEAVVTALPDRDAVAKALIDNPTVGRKGKGKKGKKRKKISKTS